MSEKDGGPAFPGFDYIDQHGKKNPEGMTLRDYFAAKALAAMLSSELILNASDDAIKARDITRAEWLADQSYKFADAMLLERAK